MGDMQCEEPPGGTVQRLEMYQLHLHRREDKNSAWIYTSLLPLNLISKDAQCVSDI